MRLFAVAGLALGLGMVSAEAATFNFDQNSNGWKEELHFDADGITLTVSGATSGGGDALVQVWAGFGLGVKSSSDCDSGRKNNQCEGDDHQVDSTGPDDVAVFLFSEAVRITSITFNYVDSADVFDFFVGDKGVLKETLSMLDVKSEVKLDNQFFSTLFGIGAEEGIVKQCYSTGHGKKKQTVCKDKLVSSAFKITSITVEKQLPQVPLPASALLLVGALGGLGLLRRRSRMAA